jgi:hypothetical protein
MSKKIFENTVVTIENQKHKKMIWLEESFDENGKHVKYKVQKSIQYKEHPNNPLNSELTETERKN